MSAEKTEQASPKRLREAREKGDVCRSQEVPSALGILALAAYFALMGGDIFVQFSTMTDVALQSFHLPYEEALPRILSVMLHGSLLVLGPLLALILATTILSNLTQVGFMVSMHTIVPRLENLSPAKWFKKIFSLKNLVEFLKNILKVLVLGYVAWRVMESSLQVLFLLRKGGLAALWVVLGHSLRDLLLVTATAFTAIAVLDFLFQKWQYAKDHRMTKEETKREFKETEGDPNIKGKRKQMYKELLQQNALDSVRRAKVLITNPTHYAIAIDYQKGKTPLPVILAKGEGAVARRMMDIAREEGIPVMRNVPLARDLFEHGTENSYIPAEYITAVAEVLRWAQSLRKE